MQEHCVQRRVLFEQSFVYGTWMQVVKGEWHIPLTYRALTWIRIIVFFLVGRWVEVGLDQCGTKGQNVRRR
jgi:hypothetical protein